MSIFISYSHKDHQLVATIAERIRMVFGQDNIFFDQWSIQPGDSIIGSMDQGLSNCKFFLYFISKNSLSSEMVKLEWMNALMKQANKQTKFIPIKIDDCLIPSILLQNLFINLYGCGLEFAVRQIIDVISNKNTYQSNSAIGFQNIRAYTSGCAKECEIKFQAEAYTEPHSKYLILLTNEENEVQWSAPADLLMHVFQKNIRLNNGTTTNGLFVSRSEPTSPNFPFQIKIKANGDSQINVIGAMRAISQQKFEFIPTIQQPK